MMKKIFLTLAVFTLSLSTFADDVMTKQPDGTYVVNSSTLCNAKGYRSATPVEVYIKDGKVLKVVCLPNQETKPYFVRITRKLLPTFEGLKIAKAMKQTDVKKVDGCTGATISQRAVQKNVAAALDYYKKHK